MHACGATSASWRLDRGNRSEVHLTHALVCSSSGADRVVSSHVMIFAYLDRIRLNYESHFDRVGLERRWVKSRQDCQVSCVSVTRPTILLASNLSGIYVELFAFPVKANTARLATPLLDHSSEVGVYI